MREASPNKLSVGASSTFCLLPDVACGEWQQRQQRRLWHEAELGSCAAVQRLGHGAASRQVRKQTVWTS